MKAAAIALVVICALLAACAPLPERYEPPPALPRAEPGAAVAPVAPSPPMMVEPQPAAPAAIVPVPGAMRAMEFFAQIRQKPARELKSEYDAVRRAFATSRSDFDRVRFALMLSLPGTPFGDEAQALELLEPLARDDRNEYRGLAQVVATLLAEQRRRGTQAAALQQKLERIKALEIEMQQRAATPENRPR